MSLDGFVADKNGSLDFFTRLTPEQNTYSDNDQLRFLDGIDTILLGRKTYELFADFWPTATTDQEIIADRLNQLNKIVFSETLKTAPWGKWNNAEIVSGELIDAVNKLKAQNGKNMVMWGSISVAQALMAENLVDEYHIQLCPTLTGGGRKLFVEPSEQLELKLIEVRQYNTGTTFLSYKVKK